MSAKIRVWIRKRNGNKQYLISYKKEILSGPWKTEKEAINAKLEWMIK